MGFVSAAERQPSDDGLEPAIKGQHPETQQPGSSLVSTPKSPKASKQQDSTMAALLVVLIVAIALIALAMLLKRRKRASTAPAAAQTKTPPAVYDRGTGSQS